MSSLALNRSLFLFFFANLSSRSRNHSHPPSSDNNPCFESLVLWHTRVPVAFRGSDQMRLSSKLSPFQGSPTIQSISTVRSAAYLQTRPSFYSTVPPSSPPHPVPSLISDRHAPPTPAMTSSATCSLFRARPFFPFFTAPPHVRVGAPSPFLHPFSSLDWARSSLLRDQPRWVALWPGWSICSRVCISAFISMRGMLDAHFEETH